MPLYAQVHVAPLICMVRVDIQVTEVRVYCDEHSRHGPAEARAPQDRAWLGPLRHKFAPHLSNAKREWVETLLRRRLSPRTIMQLHAEQLALKLEAMARGEVPDLPTGAPHRYVTLHVHVVPEDIVYQHTAWKRDADHHVCF